MVTIQTPNDAEADHVSFFPSPALPRRGYQIKVIMAESIKKGKLFPSYQWRPTFGTASSGYMASTLSFPPSGSLVFWTARRVCLVAPWGPKGRVIKGGGNQGETPICRREASGDSHGEDDGPPLGRSAGRFMPPEICRGFHHSAGFCSRKGKSRRGLQKGVEMGRILQSLP